jgi:hypothetical protein
VHGDIPLDAFECKLSNRLSQQHDGRNHVRQGESSSSKPDNMLGHCNLVEKFDSKIGSWISAGFESPNPPT